YMAYLDATSDTERGRASTEFVKDVRHHVKALTKRGYIDPPHTVAYVLMFIPNESVYAFLHDNDAQLLDVALDQRVILCSPSTLFAVLGVVRAATDAFVFERTSNEILECLGEFSKQWDAFGEALAKVERNFETARNSFDDLIGPRRRMLERQIDRIDQLTIQSEQQPMLVDASAGEPIEISGDSA
ncbi:MAG: DNA recombination protein RmuC, partial [Acidimicrobiales bacterium]